MVTRAIPLEQAESIDTNSFIDALQRFISRTGKPNTIMSDYGSNFKKGAVKELILYGNLILRAQEEFWELRNSGN